MIKYILKHFSSLLFIALVLLVLSSCGGRQGVKAIFQKRTPYEAYEHGLRQAKLHHSELGQAWLAAGQRAIQDSLLVALPFQETGYFKADKPIAASYSFKARQGEVIDVRVTTRTRQDIKLFLDLFEISTGKPRDAKHVAAADTTELKIEYRVEENLVHLIRLQPELLRSGSYTITIVTRPSLSFPVQGKDNRAIQSLWGVERDGGARRHEGVDIFAPKGTPVLASTPGTVTRVNTTPIGGKVVWLADLNGGQNIYYAHLDTQLVQAGQQVKVGDTLGLVGNTGNARYTPPHLHFGVYAFGQGAVDPYPFIYQSNQKPAPLRVSENQLGNWGRISKKTVQVRQSPTAKGNVVATLTRHTPVQVFGGTSEWYRVQMPDGSQGFLHEDNLEGITKAVKSQTLKAPTEIIEEPFNNASPIAAVEKDTEVAILGVYQMYQLVRLTNGTMGWLMQQ